MLSPVTPQRDPGVSTGVRGTFPLQAFSSNVVSNKVADYQSAVQPITNRRYCRSADWKFGSLLFRSFPTSTDA
jgi:hypothetical protein